MREIQEIITFCRQLRQEEEFVTLATLVRVEGSAYRCPGSRMLITSGGQQIGTISGGCLESDVVERSQDVFKTGIPSLVKYDTTSEDDLIWGLGLGCQGIAYILIERLNIKQMGVLKLIGQCLSSRKKGVVATVFSTEMVTKPKQRVERMLLYPDGRIISNIENSELAETIKKDIFEVLQLEKFISKNYMLTTGIAEVLLEVIVPPINLVIFGAGFDVLPVVYFAKALGWRVTVIDPRGNPQTKKRFRKCDLVIINSANKAGSQIKFDDQTVAVTMSHNYLYDLEFCQTVSTTAIKYLGILGPKKRTNRLLQDLKYAGFSLANLGLYSPVGLDIGANNPEEIALSIIAEIQAVSQNRRGESLRNRQNYIHSDRPIYTSATKFVYPDS